MRQLAHGGVHTARQTPSGNGLNRLAQRARPARLSVHAAVCRRRHPRGGKGGDQVRKNRSGEQYARTKPLHVRLSAPGAVRLLSPAGVLPGTR